jgi:hypothetical protein
MLSRLLLNGLYGTIAGFAWAFALGKEPKSGLIYGLIIGAMIGLCLYLISTAPRVRANITREEGVFVMNIQSTFLLIIAVAIAIAAWIIKLIFGSVY